MKHRGVLLKQLQKRACRNHHPKPAYTMHLSLQGIFCTANMSKLQFGKDLTVVFISIYFFFRKN